MSVIATGMDMPRSCGSCEASGTGVCKLWMKSSEINGIGYNRHPDCPIKSVEGLIEEIRKMPNDNPSYWHTCDVVDRENLIEIIKEYCKVSEKE